MMSWYERIKGYYPTIWNKTMVRNAVIKNKISEEEYHQIVGTPYPGGITNPDLETRVAALEEELEATKIIWGVD